MGLNDKNIEWIGSSKRDLLDFPKEIMREIGLALR